MAGLLDHRSSTYLSIPEIRLWPPLTLITRKWQVLPVTKHSDFRGGHKKWAPPTFNFRNKLWLYLHNPWQIGQVRLDHMPWSFPSPSGSLWVKSFHSFIQSLFLQALCMGLSVLRKLPLQTWRPALSFRNLSPNKGLLKGNFLKKFIYLFYIKTKVSSLSTPPIPSPSLSPVSV